MGHLLYCKFIFIQVFALVSIVETGMRPWNRDATELIAGWTPRV